MADPLKFVVEFAADDAPIHKVASAVDGLSNELTKAKGKLATYEAQLKLASQLGDVEGHRKYSAAVEETSRKVYDLGNKLVDMQGQTVPAASALEHLGSVAGGALTTAILAVGAAVVALGVAGVETTLEVASFNAKLEATFDALGKGPDAGKRTVEMLDDVSRTLPQSRDELAKWTREIEKAGVTDLSQVRHELLATASAQAILGEEGPAALQKIERKVHDAIEGHHKLTIASRELTKTIGTNLAGAAAERMGLSLEKLEAGLKAGTVDAAAFGNALEETLIAKGGKGLDALWMSKAWSKIKEQGKELFADVDTDPITNAMRNLLSLFDQSQPAGQGMKTTITDAFNGITKAIGYSINEALVFFLELEVAVLSVRLAMMSVSNDINNFLARKGFLGERQQEKALTQNADRDREEKSLAAKRAAGLTDEYVKTDDGQWVAVGKGVGDGLVKGMDDSLPGVTAAGKRLGEAGAKGAAEGAKVHSPSEATIQVGKYLGQGLPIGMAAEGPNVARAGRQLSANALGGLVGGALTSPPANGNGGGGLTVHIGNLTIMAPQGVTDATSLSATGLAVALERFQLGSGR